MSSHNHDDVIKWKHFPRYWPFVRSVHRSPVNSPHKGQWRGALMFSLICTWIHGWVSNREAGDLRRLRTHYDNNVPCFKMWGLSCFMIYIWIIMWPHVIFRDHFVDAPSQKETTLHCNVVSHWLGAYIKWSLHFLLKNYTYSFIFRLCNGLNKPFRYPAINLYLWAWYSIKQCVAELMQSAFANGS